MRSTALVFGATGFVGRHLISALTAEGTEVVAACRSEESFRYLTDWLARHGCQTLPTLLLVDFDSADFGIAATDPLVQGISDVYNCAGAYRFGMTVSEARTANVDGARHIVTFAARLPELRRLVHISGYRVGGQDAADVPWSPERVRRTYKALGAYEASKVESDAVVQAEAQRLGVPWTIVNPSSVSGVGSSGESDQFLGMAASFQELWDGSLAARPGNGRTFVPVVPVDYLVQFMIRLPADPDTVGQSYWVLDDATPPLPNLLSIVGEHYRVRVPRLRIPVAIVEHLPSSLTKSDPETLTFLSSDRYPVRSADEFAARHGLELPETIPSILRWADHLAAYRFGATKEQRSARRFVEQGGLRTFRSGPPDADSVVLPGLPVNADTWAATAEALSATAAVDLPGLGMSDGGPQDWPGWLDELLTDGGIRHLIGHSIGAAAAIEAASRNPGRLDRLTLVAPFFLQAPAGLLARASLLTGFVLRHTNAESLAERLTGDRAHASTLATSVADLRRAGTAGRVGRLLSRAADTRWRAELVRLLLAYDGQVHIIVGSEDALSPSGSQVIATLGARARITHIEGAGHHPQLTHPDALVVAIKSAGDRVRG